MIVSSSTHLASPKMEPTQLNQLLSPKKRELGGHHTYASKKGGKGGNLLEGLQKYIDQTNATVAKALNVEAKVERMIRWCPCSDLFPSPKIKLQNISERPVAITLTDWTMEAVCIWIGELELFLQEEAKHKPDDMYYIFSDFDVDFYDVKGCIRKPTGRIITPDSFEETILVCV